jgi:SAM-dependent methyltransferase
MKPSHLSYLRCPKTKRPLQLEIGELIDGKIKEGTLFEPGSGNKYSIINFIPRFVSPDNYTNNFGLEWNKHSRTQYDETSGFDISGERFRNETKWEQDLTNELILEAGSGSGRFTKHAIETGAMVVSFDYSASVEANYNSNGQKENLLIVQASIFEMPFEPGSFDRVFCFGVLQHTPDPRKAFQCLVQSIRKGGHISSDIYLKSFAKVFLSPKYLIRRYTKNMNPERLYILTEKYIRFMWPFSKLLRRIPKAGKMINWRMMIADYSSMLKNADEKTLKEWAILDTYDMISPAYDFPATLKTFRNWHIDEELVDIDVQYGYNGVEARAIKAS